MRPGGAGMKLKYIRASAVRGQSRGFERRVGRDFLTMLDDFVHAKIESACQQHNGGKKTLDKHVAAFIGLAIAHKASTSGRRSSAICEPVGVGGHAR